jgi:SAM-dependent methyltransferase
MAATRDKKSVTITTGIDATGYLRKNCIEDEKKVVRITPELAEAIARQKLPFTERAYYTFCEKYLPENVEEILYHDEEETYFREIATDYDTLKYISFLRRFYASPELCDIGCGIGNVLHFAQKLGYKAFGYELNKGLQPLHKKLQLDVVQGNILETDMTRLATADIVYMYRPVNNDKLMNKLFRKIYDTTKPNIVMLYNYPHSYKIKGFDTIRLGVYDADMIVLLKK